MRPRHRLRTATATVVLALVAGAGTTVPPRDGPAEDARRTREHWTAERVAAAAPRDLVVDAHGRDYVRTADGELVPRGHAGSPAATPLRAVPTDRPAPGPDRDPGNGRPAFDTDPPEVTDPAPAPGATIGGTQAFGAVVADASGVKDVEVHVAFPAESPPQTFHATREGPGTDRWSVVLEGLEGQGIRGTWWVEARDGARRGGNTTTTPAMDFWVVTSDDGVGSGGSVMHAPWTAGGAVGTATARVLFELPSSEDPTVWTGWWCSGTVVADDVADRSMVLTAAHCIFDEVNDVFARNVLVVPDQDGTTATGSNRLCDDDPLGCWAASHGVVTPGWATGGWPDSIPSDHGWYVVPGTGAHLPGTHPAHETLDVAVTGLPVAFDPLETGSFTHALGFSSTHDPQLMYCAEPVANESTHGGYWLDACGLSGGASGGPWIHPLDPATGSGPVVSLNSWRLSGRDGMGGPDLSSGGAACTFAAGLEDAAGEEDGLVATGC